MIIYDPTEAIAATTSNYIITKIMRTVFIFPICEMCKTHQQTTTVQDKVHIGLHVILSVPNLPRCSSNWVRDHRIHLSWSVL